MARKVKSSSFMTANTGRLERNVLNLNRSYIRAFVLCSCLLHSLPSVRLRGYTILNP